MATSPPLPVIVPVARGKALPRDEATLEEISQVTDEDIEAARAFWEAHAPARFKGLIEADVRPADA